MTLYRQKNNKYIYALAFFIPIIILLAIFMLRRVYPFGNNTLLISDCDGQYVDYLSYFKTLFTSNNNFFYTFSKNLGGDIVGLSAYYLLSPINIILFFFENKYLPIAIMIIILIKIGLCGLSFNYFINHVNKSNVNSIIFSTSYALMAYNATYFWDIMWIDGVILLPIIIYGIEKIFNKENCLTYVTSLALALITNYYIGFMLCIFSFIYFIYRSFIYTNQYKSLKPLWARFYNYSISSILSVGLSSFVLIPTFLSLQGGKAGFSIETLKFKENYKFIDVFSKLFSNTINDYQIMDGLPNIFCGMLITLLVILYFFNKKISNIQKIASAGMLSVILISFHVNTLNLVWHGFNPPAWFPYRYSFLFSFLLIYFAYQCFINFKEGIEKKHILYSIIIFISSSFIIFRKDFDFINLKNIYLDLFIFLSLSIVFYYYNFKKIKNSHIITFIALIQVFNLSLNFFLTLRHLQNFASGKMDNFYNYVDTLKPVIDKIKSDDNSFYRLEKTFQRSHNDSMQFNYNGLSHYSSCEKTFVKSFLEKMGFRNNINWAYYNKGSTISIDSFLGVKYLLAKDKINKPYNLLFEENNISVYQNPYVLPIGFAISDKVQNVDIWQDNLFEIQNDIFNNMTNISSNNIFTQESNVEIQLDNLQINDSGRYISYNKINKNKDAFISYKIKVNQVYPLYFYSSAPFEQSSELILNGNKYSDYFNTYNWGIINLGSFNQNEIIDFKIKINTDTLELTNIYFYYENLDNLKIHYNKLISQACNMEKISSSHLKGNVNILEDNQYLLLTIPFEKDWKVTLDNNLINCDTAFDTFMAIPITKGKHSIEIKYIPRGFKLSLITTTISLVILLILFIKHRKDKSYNI